jgi:hypothetical protein
MKKIIFLTIFSLFVLAGWQICHAVDFQLNLNYPNIQGATSPSSNSTLPGLINYIYKFALLACGITALVSILIGAFQYVTSAGDSSKAGDAKERITQALLGILVLLASVLILRTINPDLVTLSLSLPTTTTGGGGSGGGYGYQDSLLKCYSTQCDGCTTCTSTCSQGKICTSDNPPPPKQRCIYCCGQDCNPTEQVPTQVAIDCVTPVPTMEKCKEAAAAKCGDPVLSFNGNIQVITGGCK